MVERMYDFDGGLADVERLEVLISSPLLRAVAPALPAYGATAHRASADPAALVVVGAATVICGSDRAADRELRCHWVRIRKAFQAAGYRVGVQPIRTQTFRDYRDAVLSSGLPNDTKGTLRELYIGLAKQIGLFPESDAPWNNPDLRGVVTSDGTWFAAASQVRDQSESRSRLGNPRVIADADQGNKETSKGWGYMFCLTTVRGPAARQRVVLDVSYAPNSSEMDVVIPQVQRLRARLGDRFRCFVYDGALRGVHHRAIRAAGVVSVTKPWGRRPVDYWKRYLGTPIGKAAKVVIPDTGCDQLHPLSVTAGMVWELERSAIGGFQHARVLDVADLRRSGSEAQGFVWEIDLIIRCDHGDHVLTLDPNSMHPCAKGAALINRTGTMPALDSTVNLSEQLRMVQVHEDQFAKLYGVRSDSESGNKNAKYDFGLGQRSRSFNVVRHEIDMWLYSLLANALVWQEHCQREARSSTRHLQAAA